MNEIYTSRFVYDKLGDRWAVLDSKNRRILSTCKTLDRAMELAKGYKQNIGKWRTLLVSISPDNVRN